ncbi:MAG TPA: CCA tRNA nucleotidyltransferase [Candidatus Limnocylindria bacterium]|nr:CCA tRNA nucleotidyltransferase [Candidatus Limnocylindria bacterium]
MPPDRELVFPHLPDDVARVLHTLTDAGHEAVLVGGSVRDRIVGAPLWDWDAATSARPEVVAELFPGATWENRFGTVTTMGDPPVQVTSYRAEGAYPDRRRPDEVTFGVSLADDLARRDFTINAIAWRPVDLAAGRGTLVDPFGGERDLEARLLRTVGEPRDRFGEDALRLVRAARLAGRYGLRIEPATEAAIRALAPTVASVSGERLRDELLRILDLDPVPSAAFLHLERLGLLGFVLPELAALRGVPQAKRAPGDALDHTLAAVEAIRLGEDPDLRLTALLHDLGKAMTSAGGHFIGHDAVGADLAGAVLERLRFPRARSARVVAAIRHHMYDYDPAWTDAAVRRFIRRTADVDRGLLFGLRHADNVASGLAGRGEPRQAELEARIRAELDGHSDLLVHRRLAIDGHDLQRELGLPPGPEIGAILDRLEDAVLEDPTTNEPAKLLELARRR